MSEKVQWPVACQEAALAEGWDLFSTDRDPRDELGVVNGKPYGYRPFELQRYEEAGIFAADQDAWRFVWYRAQDGSPLHQQALAFLQQESPEEYTAIALSVTPPGDTP